MATGIWQQLNTGYRHTYKPENFSLDTLREALREYFGEPPRKPRKGDKALMVILPKRTFKRKARFESDVFVKDPTRLLKIQNKFGD